MAVLVRQTRHGEVGMAIDELDSPVQQLTQAA
jgi:hypothetical protein